MKLHSLFEAATSRQVFLEFQQRLIDMDDGFETDEPVMTGAEPAKGSGVVTYHFVRPEKSKTHNVRYVDIKCYTYDGSVEDFKVTLYERAGGAKMPMRKGQSAGSFPVISTVDEAMVYLDRVLNAKS